MGTSGIVGSVSHPQRISVARRLLYSLAPLVFVLLFGEAATRLLWKRPGIDELDGTGLAPHPTRIWSLDASEQEQQFAGSFQLDPNGMRLTRRTNAPHLVMTVGDSSIFGHGLTDEQTLHESLSRSLGMRGIHADVLRSPDVRRLRQLRSRTPPRTTTTTKAASTTVAGGGEVGVAGERRLSYEQSKQELLARRKELTLLSPPR